MLGMSGSSPRFCLKVGATHLVWGEASRTWRGKRRYQCVYSPIPAGLVKLSPLSPNIRDGSALERHLSSLTVPADRMTILGRRLFSRMPRWITLVLPDLAVRASVMRFEHMPVRIEEQEALIRWRLGQEQRIPLGGAKLSWQLFPVQEGTDGECMVLVVAVQDSVLSQYESACEAAGLLPREVRVAGFLLFDLWLKAAGGRGRLNDDIAWVSVADGGLTCLIIHGGRPVFVRTKPLTGETGQVGDIRRLEWKEKIIREAGASLSACRELYPELCIRTIVVAVDQEVSGLEQALGEELQAETEHFNWDYARTVGWIHDEDVMPLAALPAVAGMV